MSSSDHFKANACHIPSKANGYTAWLVALAVVAATTAEWLGSASCIIIVFVMNLLQFRSRKSLFRESQPLKAAFFLRYWSVPEAYIMMAILTMKFIAVVCTIWLRERSICSSTLSVDSILVGIVTPFLTMSMIKVHSNDGPSSTPNIYYRLLTGGCASAIALFVLHVASTGYETTLSHVTTSCDSSAVLFQSWAPIFGAALALDWPGHGGFYKWHSRSEMGSETKPRGLGFSNYLPYGFLQVPKLSVDGCSYLGALLAIVVPSVAIAAPMVPVCLMQKVILGLLFPAFTVYASQFGQESSLGEHHSIPVFAAMLYLGLGWGTAWSTALLKLHMITLYHSAGLLKVISSLYAKKAWWGISSMQAFLFSARFSRPAEPGSLRDTLRCRILQSPALCVGLAVSGLLFELLSPAVLFHSSLSSSFAFVALTFHFGVFLLQGISFLSYWSPVLLVFIIDHEPVTFAGMAPSPDANTLETLLWSLAIVHLVGQCVFAYTFHEAWAPQSPLPFSCMPVFAIPVNIFAPPIPAPYCLIGGSVDSTGHMGPLEWQGPHFRDPSYRLTEDDVKAIPFPVVWLQVGQPVKQRHMNQSQQKIAGLMKIFHPFYAQWENQFFNLYHEKINEDGCSLYSNFPIPENLREAIVSTCELIRSRGAEDCANAEVMTELLTRQSRCMQIFADLVFSTPVPATDDLRFHKRDKSFLKGPLK